MRTILVSFIFMISVPFCNSQILVKENRIWSNLEYGTEQPDQQFYHSYYIRFQGDTIIDNTTYKKVYRADDSLHMKWWSYGFTREDSTGKVYALQVRGTNYNDSETLIYDFSLIKGDSISNNDGGYIYVDSVTYIELVSKSYRAIFLSSGDEWISGIGSFKGVFHGINNIFECCVYKTLLCMSENDTLIYHNNNSPSCYLYHYPAGLNHILKIKDVFNFEIGDEFQNKTTFNGQGPPNADRITVINKTYSISGDSVSYTLHHDRYTSSISNQIIIHSFDQYNSTVTYTTLDSNILSMVSIDSLTYGLNLYKGSLCSFVTNSYFVRDPYYFGEVSYKLYEYGMGLGQTKYIDAAPEGSWEITMFYYNKHGIACGIPDLTTNIDYQITPDFLKVYPNPFSNYLIIESDKEIAYNYSFYDLAGREVYSGKLCGKINNIELPGIPSGVYFLQIDQIDKSFHLKVIKH
jgi:hypothetical protein